MLTARLNRNHANGMTSAAGRLRVVGQKVQQEGLSSPPASSRPRVWLAARTVSVAALAVVGMVGFIVTCTATAFGAIGVASHLELCGAALAAYFLGLSASYLGDSDVAPGRKQCLTQPNDAPTVMRRPLDDSPTPPQLRPIGAVVASGKRRE
jgi:hypothetical protein